MDSTRNRRLAAVVVTTAALAVPLAGTPAAADPLERILEVVTDINCSMDTAEGDVVVFRGENNNRFGSSAWVIVEGPAPEFETRLYGETFGAPWDGSSFEVTVPLVVPGNEEPAGDAQVVGTFTEIGEPWVEEVRHRDGNAWTFGTSSITELAIDVTAVDVPGYTVLTDTASCDGSTTVLDFTTTNPAASVSSSVELAGGCELEGLDDLAIDMDGSLRELRFQLAGLADGGNASGTVPLRAGAGTTTVDVIDDNGDVLTQATVSLVLREAGPVERESFREHGLHYRATSQPYELDVAVTTADGGHATGTCSAGYFSDRLIDSPPGEEEH